MYFARTIQLQAWTRNRVKRIMDARKHVNTRLFAQHGLILLWFLEVCSVDHKTCFIDNWKCVVDHKQDQLSISTYKIIQRPNNYFGFITHLILSMKQQTALSSMLHRSLYTDHITWYVVWHFLFYYTCCAHGCGSLAIRSNYNFVYISSEKSNLQRWIYIDKVWFWSQLICNVRSNISIV